MLKNAVDSKDAGIQNERIVLNQLRLHGTLSQAQLCKNAKLGSSTASYIVGRLRVKSLIIEKQGESSKRGAKPVFLSINPTGKYTIGTEITPNNIYMGLFDFNCQLIETVHVYHNEDCSPENVCNNIEINLRGLLSKHDIPYEKLSSLGVTLSASISRDGHVVLASPLKWQNVPLKTMLQTALNIDISISPTRVRLLAEGELSDNQTHKNILYINIADGVGSHTISDNHLLHGANNRAGEIGHVVIDPNGPLCGCGHQGCLETFISGPALTQRINQDIKQSKETILSQTLKPSDLPKEVITKWGDAIKQNDAYALALQTDIATLFSKTIAVAINCFDPSTVILGGYVSTQCFNKLKTTLESFITTDVFDHQSRKIEIRQVQNEQDALITGAAKQSFHLFEMI